MHLIDRWRPVACQTTLQLVPHYRALHDSEISQHCQHRQLSSCCESLSLPYLQPTRRSPQTTTQPAPHSLHHTACTTLQLIPTGAPPPAQHTPAGHPAEAINTQPASHIHTPNPTHNTNHQHLDQPLSCCGRSSHP